MTTAAFASAGLPHRMHDRAIDTGSRVRALFTPSAPDAAAREKLDHAIHELVSSAAVRRSSASTAQLGDGLDAYIEFLTASAIRDATNVSSPRCLGNMSGPTPAFMRLIAETVAALNQNLVKRDASSSMTPIESEIIGSFHALVYGPWVRPADTAPLGVAASGGTLANLTALWCARNVALRGVQHDGVASALRNCGSERAVIIGSELMHYSIDKAACVLGLGERAVIRLRVDSAGCVPANAVREALRRCKSEGALPIALIGIAGTTDCGSIDPLDAIADAAAETGVHYHVDAAWGAAMLYSARQRERLRGIERADSVTIDAHKQLYAPVGLSYVLLRSPESARAIEREAHYVLQNGSGDLGMVSLEGSRSAASLFAHGALHVITPRGFEWLVDHSVETAKAFAERIDHAPEFELLAAPETNIVLYRYVPRRWRTALAAGALSTEAYEEIDALNRRLQADQLKAGRAYVARTTIAHLAAYPGTRVTALRAVLANPLTTADDLAFVLDDQRAIAALIEEEAA